MSRSATATAIAVTAKPSVVNAHRLGMLGLNLGLWTLIVVIVRALYA
ncbi:hypothetical protein [Caulobacter soli]|nr:hypothetical protein [Caulobacter soli]